ncbi:MAG: aminoglycoside 6-adenylyltransferase [Gemmatimonadetes bacterium]|nr:aminoglycoside 6-adenylyltransferase [Gemmatimonadota bacterium]
MRTEEEILTQFDRWAQSNDLIRAAVLTSSRVGPEGAIDFLSDYDIELFVADMETFQKDDEWLGVFGPIMVRWPFKPRSTFDEQWLTRLVLFKDGVRIDFQITDQMAIKPDAYEDGYKILVDKDNLTAELNEPTYSQHFVKKPSQEEYDVLVHEFWWNATYVPKYLWRDELPFAASMLGQAVRDKYLRTVIEWSIGLQHDWSVNTGVCGKRFKRYLDAETWSEFESTFAGADIEENWQAFSNGVTLFGKLARIVGSSLDYDYPAQMEEEMINYYSKIRNTKKSPPSE